MRAIGALVLLVLIGGCANWNAVYRTKTIGSNRPRAITVDAKQRNVLMVPEPLIADGKYSSPDNAGGWRMCAEASPDVFSALAASASGALKVDAKSQSGEAKAALAIAETAATIERTQTINLLRESFYRTCERYLSGAISRSELVVQSGRDWRAMIAILAIEQLTRTARPTATVLVAGGTSASVTTPLEMADALGRANADIASKQTEVDRLTKAKDAICADGDKDCAAAKDGAAQTLPGAQRNLQSAQSTHDDLLKLSGASPLGGAAAATAGVTRPTPIKEGERSASDLASVAYYVDHIATQAFQTNEMQLFCIQQLDRLSSGRLYDSCLGLLASAADSEKGQFEAAIQEIGKESLTLFATFWEKVIKADGTVDPDLLRGRVNSVTVGRKVPPRLASQFEQLRSATSKDQARPIFLNLSANDKQKLAN